MSEQMPIQLTDERIERMVRERAGAGAPVDLVASIVRVTAATPQRRRSWFGLLDPRDGSRQRLMLVTTLLALVLIGAAIAVVGSRLRDDRSVAPSPPAPSNGLVATNAPPSAAPSPRVDPAQSPEPSVSPTSREGACGTTPPPDQPRITTIDLPTKAYLRVTFADCAVWVTNNENGRGIHMVDLASNKVVRTVLKGPIQNPVFAVRSDGDDLWAITWGDPIKLQRIDPTSGKPDRSIAMPQADAGGGVWVLGARAWAGADPLRPTRRVLKVVDLETGAITATIKDLVPIDMWRDASAVWAIALPSAIAPDAPDGHWDLVHIDPSTFELTRVPLPRELTDLGPPSIAHVDGLFLGGAGEVVHLSTTGAIVRRIPVAHADLGVRLVWTETGLWGLPIESTPMTKGFDNRTRELIRLDPQTGVILRRIPLHQIGPMDLAYGYGSLWILAPDDDYSRTFGMHLIRVELPAGT